MFLNLLKHHTQQYTHISCRKFYGIFSASLLCVVLSIYFIGHMIIRQSSQIQQERQSIKIALEKLAPIVQQLHDAQKKQQKLQQLEEIIAQYDHINQQAVHLFDNLALAPEGVLLRRIDKQKQTLHIEGLTRSNQLISRYLAYLNATYPHYTIKLMQSKVLNEKTPEVQQFGLPLSTFSLMWQM